MFAQRARDPPFRMVHAPEAWVTDSKNCIPKWNERRQRKATKHGACLTTCSYLLPIVTECGLSVVDTRSKRIGATLA